MSSDSTPQPAQTKPVSTRRWVLRSAVLVAILFAVGTGVYLRWWRQNLRRFAPVRPGVFYRSGQPSQRGLTYLADRYGVKTDLSLRRNEPRLRTGLLFKHSNPDGPSEEEWANALGIRYLLWPMGDEVLLALGASPALRTPFCVVRRSGQFAAGRPLRRRSSPDGHLRGPVSVGV